MGLDVHDVGSWTAPIEAGMVFTCEPGIYIPEEKSDEIAEIRANVIKEIPN